MTAGFCHPHGTPMTAPRDMSDSFTWLHCDMIAGASNDFVECNSRYITPSCVWTFYTLATGSRQFPRLSFHLSARGGMVRVELLSPTVCI